MANFLHTRGKYVTVHNKFSKIQPSASMPTGTAVRESCVVRGTFEGLLCIVAQGEQQT